MVSPFGDFGEIMKKLAFLVLGFCVWQSALSQTAIKTEYASGLFLNHTGTASIDTLYDFTRTSANGTKVASGVVVFLDKVTINTAVASDTIIIKEGSSAGAGRLIGTIILGATPVSGPVTVTYGVKIDSNYVWIQRKKTSDVTSIFRKGY